MARVARALDRIKQDLGPHLSPEMIESACEGAGHVWRERKLGPVATVHLFVLQVLHFNTAIRHLRHLAGFPANAAAYLPGADAAAARSAAGTAAKELGVDA